MPQLNALAAALLELAEVFAEWKAGKLNAFDLSDAIHEFHQTTSRELFKQYEAGSTSVPDFALVSAVLNDFIKLEEIGVPGREHIAAIVEGISTARRAQRGKKSRRAPRGSPSAL